MLNIKNSEGNYNINYPSIFVEDQELSALLALCVEGNWKRILKVLNQQPRFLNYFDKDGWNCLVNASKSGYLELVKILLAMGASLLPTSKHSALRGAAIFGFLDVCRCLIENGHAVDALSAGF